MQKECLEKVYFAGGCLWGVQEFLRHLPGVIVTEAGRVNGTTSTTKSPYDGYAECVKVTFDPSATSIATLMACFFEIIDPFSFNRQGDDIGPKYRTGVYSEVSAHLEAAREFIAHQPRAAEIAVEVLRLTNFVPSEPEHQDRLSRCPDDYCHIPKDILHKYKT